MFKEDLSQWLLLKIQKQLSRVVLRRKHSENMQQINMRTPIPKCNFNKVALKWYVFSLKIAVYIQNSFS